ncbi:MAG: GNAT family N-acyltransferase [Candidatus Zixiibacteriota bacterium]
MLRQNQQTRSPFELPVVSDARLRRIMFKLVKKPAEKVLGLRRLNKMYRQVVPPDIDAEDFTQLALDILNVKYSITPGDYARIPATGPVIVLANHPFGGIEGILLASLLGSVRSDFKLMANYLLGRIPQMKPLLIEVDPFGSTRAASRNIRPLKDALELVRNGGMLGVFPSGEVAHRRWKRRQVTDPKWSTSIGRLIRRAGAPVLPVYFDGANSRLFQWAGLVHRHLRTALLPHELLNKANRTIPIRVGKLLTPERLARMPDDRSLMEYIRLRTYLLADRAESSTTGTDNGQGQPGKQRAPAVIESQPQDLLEAELARLPDDAVLTTAHEYVVYHSRAESIPTTLMEIGRLREVTFREIGEGTGRETDLDKYDKYYIHLFVWNKQKSELVGAYRLGPTDRVVSRYGIKGLYTRSLYKYKRSMIESIWPALELGRSFVQPKYQREYAPLHLLWKGIGQYILRHPHYRYLFGPVSISRRYHSTSVRLMVDYLKRHNLAQELARYVKPTNPYKHKRSSDWDDTVTGRLLSDLDEISALVAEIESEKQGVPILLKHYLRLGGRVLGFNLDSQFSDVIDALILVDLLHTDHRILARYFGHSEAEEFLRYHGRQAQPAHR